MLLLQTRQASTVFGMKQSVGDPTERLPSQLSLLSLLGIRSILEGSATEIRLADPGGPLLHSWHFSCLDHSIHSVGR